MKLGWIQKWALNQAFGVKTGGSLKDAIENGQKHLFGPILLEWYERNYRK